MRKLPPTDPKPTEVLIDRKPFCDTVVVYLLNGDSFRLSFDELRTFIRLVVNDNLFVNHACDRVRNFFCIHIDLLNKKIRHLPQQEISQLLRPSQNSKAEEVKEEELQAAGLNVEMA